VDRRIDLKALTVVADLRPLPPAVDGDSTTAPDASAWLVTLASASYDPLHHGLHFAGAGCCRHQDRRPIA
jgi:hypothetical protein